MQVSEQSIHLFIGESSRKGRHHSLASKDYFADFRICSRCSARQGCSRKYLMQVGRNLFQPKVVVFVTVRTAD